MGSSWSTENIPDLRGKNAIVTGANSGLGMPTSLALARAGAHVFMLCRNEGKARAAVKELQEDCPTGTFEIILGDISDFASAREAGQKFVDTGKALDILINNAGIMELPTRELSRDGCELQVATNHLGHFALTLTLIPALQRSAQPRIVNVSSMMAEQGNARRLIDVIGNPMSHPYGPSSAYSDSKLANLLFTFSLNRKYPGIKTITAHPGVSSTNLFQHNSGSACFVCCCRCCLVSAPSNGALPSLRAACDPEAEQGSYYGPARHFTGPPVVVAVPFSAQHTLGEGGALLDEFWAASEAAVGSGHRATA